MNESKESSTGRTCVPFDGGIEVVCLVSAQRMKDRVEVHVVRPVRTESCMTMGQCVAMVSRGIETADKTIM